uniref:GOLD domain-containing protein n=1 Tax=Mola mola TaxID=94237 RepID=A0A3Q3VVV2_MOLML
MLETTTRLGPDFLGMFLNSLSHLNVLFQSSSELSPNVASTQHMLLLCWHAHCLPVISGGNYDVDCFITDPQNNVLYNEQKKQYDSFSHTTAMSGVYKICFSNEFSTFTHKTVYLEFRHGDEQPLLQSMTSVTALTQLESSCVSIHEILKVVGESQTWYRLREAYDRTKAEHLLQRVTYWSIGETVLLFVIGIGQVMLLRSFFTEKKGSVAATT